MLPGQHDMGITWNGVFNILHVETEFRLSWFDGFSCVIANACIVNWTTAFFFTKNVSVMRNLFDCCEQPTCWGQMLAGEDLMKFWGTMLIQTVKVHISCSYTFYILLTIIFMIWAQHSRDLWCQHCYLEPGCAVVRVHPHRFSNWKALVFLSNDTTWICLDFLLREAMASNGKSHEHGQVWSGAGKTQDIDVCSIVWAKLEVNWQ